MRHPEYQYLDLMKNILENGEKQIDRTGVGTLSIFGANMRFDLSDGTFPLLTTKRVYWKTAVKEMLWFFTGQTNIQSLLRENVKIWTDWPLDKYRKATGEMISQEDFEKKILEDDEFAMKWGDLGPVYGKQWRKWLDAEGKEHDQIANVINTLKNNPQSRRIIFHAWNVGEIENMALPPCHMVYQFRTKSIKGSNKLALDIILFQRSGDTLIGIPFNLCGAATILTTIARQADMLPGELIWMGGDTHIYLNHLDAVRTQLSREPRPFPKLELVDRGQSIDEYKIEDFRVIGYDPHPPIEAPVAV